MCEICDAKARGISEEVAYAELYKRLLADVEKQGAALVAVDEGDVQTVYTVGLAKRGLPDVVVHGLHVDIARNILQNFVMRHIETLSDPEIAGDRGASYSVTNTAGVSVNFIVGELDLTESLKVFGTARAFYQHLKIDPVGFVQVYWPDENDRTILDVDANTSIDEQIFVRPKNLKLHSVRFPMLKDTVDFLGALEKMFKHTVTTH